MIVHNMRFLLLNDLLETTGSVYRGVVDLNMDQHDRAVRCDFRCHPDDTYSKDKVKDDHLFIPNITVYAAMNINCDS